MAQGARYPAAGKVASEPQLSPSQDVGVDVCVITGAWVLLVGRLVWRLGPADRVRTRHRNKS
jgi:hypothetical protein